jgi:hypothetical protein
MKTLNYLTAMLILGISLVSCSETKTQSTSEVTFVSFPDFFNFDVPAPWPRWDDAVDFFLNEVTREEPNFVLVAGDLVNGHWWESPQCVEQMGTLYYSSWKRHLEKHGLTYYTAVGDHELGDDPWPAEKLELVPHLENIYNRMLQMPQNGPENKKGLAYYVREGDVLVVTVETFEIINDSMVATVTGKQLQWFNEVMEQNSDAKFKIIQGHVPVWGEIKARSSSAIMLHNGRENPFYQSMKKYDVDLYLCGEFHDVTILEADGIWQVVHGSSWGREIVNTQDYLVARTDGDKLKVEMKQIGMEASGGHMWNLHKNRGPREKVTITDESKQNGPKITGTLVIEKTDAGKKFLEKTGVFEL